MVICIRLEAEEVNRLMLLNWLHWWMLLRRKILIWSFDGNCICESREQEFLKKNSEMETCTNGTTKRKRRTIIGNDVETKQNTKRWGWKRKATRKENWLSWRHIAHETCPSYALNYVAFYVMLSIWMGFSLARRVCRRLFILKVYQVVLIAIHQMNCTSFSSLLFFFNLLWSFKFLFRAQSLWKWSSSVAPRS